MGGDDAAFGGFAGDDAGAVFFGGVEGDAADGGFGLVLEFLFGFVGAVPVDAVKAAIADAFFVFVVAVAIVGVVVNSLFGAVE